MVTNRLDSNEIATVLAALRFWQRQGGPRQPEWEIAISAGPAALDCADIEALCERLKP